MDKSVHMLVNALMRNAPIWTERATQILEAASQLAFADGVARIRDKDVVLAALQEGQNVFCAVLKRWEITYTSARTFWHYDKPVADTGSPDAPRAHGVIAENAELADAVNEQLQAYAHRYAGGEHLGLAIMARQEPEVVELLRAFGTTCRDVEEAILDFLGLRRIDKSKLGQ